MGSGPSALAVAQLNRSLKTYDGTHMLQDKLSSCPGLLSAATPVLSSTAGTPLHTACERKQVEVVQQMMSFLSGANLSVVREALKPYCRRHGLALPNSAAEGVRIAVDMTNCKGQTPLMCACAAGSPELVKLLLAQGADPWVADRCGNRTALHYAAMTGSAPCIETLMQNMSVRNLARQGVRYVDARSLCGISALHYAAFFEHAAAVEELLRHGPHLAAASSGHSYDIFVTCPALSTPLHFAATRGNVAIVRQLLQYHVMHSSSSGAGARDPRLRANSERQLPWEVAAAHHTAHRELLQLLHPGRPLEEALGLAPGSSGSAPGSAWAARTGPPSLAAIAAAALQTRLLADLDSLGRQGQSTCSTAPCPVAREGRTHSVFDTASMPAWSGTAVAVLPVRAPLSALGMSHPSRSAPLSDDGFDGEAETGALCGVCFAAREAVAPAGCGHGVCGRCAAQMCRMALTDSSRPRPLLCPFCRREVSGFVAAAVRAAQPETTLVSS